MVEECPKPRLIPVLDVAGCLVVRAIGGRRKEYQPVVSKLTTSTEPLQVAAALVDAAQTTELYVADLDAITGKALISRTVAELVCAGEFSCWIDAGIRTYEQFLALPFLAGVRQVIASETCPGPYLLTDIIANGMAANLAFSIDLRDGEVVGAWRAWGLRSARDSLGLARKVVELGVRRLVVLDLARVGTGAGSGTEELLRSVRGECPGVELIAGGGVKTWADVERMGEAGADGVLVASALHDGTIAILRR
jgi:phosphoribosylformimino-5-aminoimidazole carboxamide ribotide isomerase